MQAMTATLGPYASKEALLYHLRAARGKVNYAVNTYFRAVLAEKVILADFEPRGYAYLADCKHPMAPSAATDSATAQSDAAQSTLDSIPGPVIEQILMHTNLLTLCNIAAVCTTLHKASQSAILWQSLYERRWGRPEGIEALLCGSIAQHTDCYHTSSSQPAQQTTWSGRYRHRHLSERCMQCPACRKAKVIPIVYGFPSHLLVRNMKANKLRMGNDHLIDGQPTWVCSGCSVEFTDFPFTSLELGH